MINGLICVRVRAEQPELEFRMANIFPVTLAFEGLNIFFSLTLAELSTCHCMPLFLMLIFLRVIFLCDKRRHFNQSTCHCLRDVTFAAEEANSNPDLLSHFTFSCLKADSCQAEGAAPLVAVTMVTRDEVHVPNVPL